MIPLRDNTPLARFPLLTALLIAANLIVYLLAVHHGGSLGGPSQSVAAAHGAIPGQLTHGGAGHALAKVLGAMFLQGSFAALLANVLALALCGPPVEDALGRPRFLALYMLGGLIATGALVAAEPHSSVPVLGAGGAVAAVLGGYVVLAPRARILAIAPVPFYVTLVAVPAALLLGLWFIAQLAFDLAGLAGPAGGAQGIDFLAPVCGFAFGLLATRALARARRASEPALPVY